MTAGRLLDAWGQGVETNLPRNIDPWGYNAKWGYYYDRETQLYLCQHRMYDASTGRWLNRDPIGLAGGINLYGYCASGPVGASDPRGFDATDDFLQWRSDFFGGWGDALTFGGTGLVRQGMGTDDYVARNSGWYTAGQVAGTLHGPFIMPGASAEDGAVLLFANGGRKGAHAAYQAARRAGKGVGKRGNADHIQTVRECELSVKAENPNWVHVSGGSLPERITGGRRYADLHFQSEALENIFYQIVRTRKHGEPASREWWAGFDLAGDGVVHFVPIPGR